MRHLEKLRTYRGEAEDIVRGLVSTFRRLVGDIYRTSFEDQEEKLEVLED